MKKMNRSPLTVLADFIPYLWPVGDFATKRRVLLALSLLILHKVINVGVPLIYGQTVDLVAEKYFVLAALFAVVGAYAGARLLVQIFSEMMHFVFARVAQNSIRTLALATFRHLHKLSLRFHLDRQTGGLSRVIERGTKSIELLLTFLLFNIVPTILEILFVCLLFWWWFDWRYALASLLTIVVYSVYTISVTEWRIKFRRRMNEQDKQANTRAIDSLLNYETVKYFNAEEFEAQRYNSALRRYEDAAVKSRTSLSLLNIGQGVVIALGTISVMVLAGLDVAAGVLTIGLFASVNMYILQMYLPLNFLGTVYREIRQTLIDMEEMFALLAEGAEVSDVADAATLTVDDGAVEFRNVSFTYGRSTILENISFKVAGGKKCAIVGMSGAGKSTIARLLYRFYDPQSGAILINGQDIHTCTQHSVRACIGIVPQDTVLFNDTLLYNIRYGRADASEEEVRQVAEAADIANFIANLPEGYNTMVGERGLKLSGGEKQRVAIARALLKNPAIYLFDEATSALDSRTEKNIQQALNAISRTRTTLVIAHRLSTIVDADEIIVLADGKIAESGTHMQLLQQNGLYAGMWQRQNVESSGTQ
ncbi:MAG: ABC transporter ATP-binding protein/permease [Proteobacteria bacterium]|nr:ABC transporter ATP-binding protein/permease [Pseudomonadota bacterium]